MGIPKRAPKPVLDHSINDLIMAHSMTPSGMGEYERGLAHVLHAPGDNDICIPGFYPLGSHDYRFHARSANLVDRGFRDVLAYPRPQRGLASRILAQPGLQNIAHDHLISLFRPNPSPGKDLFDYNTSQLNNRDISQ